MLEILRGTLQQNLHPPFELCASTRGRLEWVERTAACGEHEKRKSNILDHLLIQKRNADSHLLLDTEAGVAWSARNIANRAGEVDGTA
jgi:hypothetical protein